MNFLVNDIVTFVKGIIIIIIVKDAETFFYFFQGVHGKWVKGKLKCFSNFKILLFFFKYVERVLLRRVAEVFFEWEEEEGRRRNVKSFEFK